MTVLERVPVDDILVRAREVRVGRVLGRAVRVLARVALAVVVGVLYGIGWLARKAVLAQLVAGTSVRLGWQDAGRPPGVARGSA